LILELINWHTSFKKYVPKHLISLLYNSYYIFGHFFDNLKNTDSQNVFSQKGDFESWLCDQTR